MIEELHIFEKKKLSRVKWIASQFLYNGIGKTTVAINVLVKFTGEKIMILYYAARLQCFFFLCQRLQCYFGHNLWWL